MNCSKVEYQIFSVNRTDLVHETKAVESSDVARVNHGLALRVRPVAGHRHDRVHNLDGGVEWWG